jgi:hypothetical protein
MEDVAPKHQEKKPIDLNKLTQKDKQRQAGLVSLYGMIGAGLMLVNPADAMVVMGSAEECATAWVRVAKVQPKVGNAIDTLINGTVWGGLITVHIAMATAIMSNHGLSFKLPGVPGQTYEEKIAKEAQEIDKDQIFTTGDGALDPGIFNMGGLFNGQFPTRM